MCILCALPLVPSAGGRRGWPAEGPLRLGPGVLAGHMPLAPTWLGLGLRMGSTVLRRGSNPTPTFIRPSASASTRRPSFSRSCIRHDPMCQRDVAGRTLGPLPRCRSARRLTRRVSGAGSRLPRDPCALARRGRAAVYSNSLLSQESTCAAVVVIPAVPCAILETREPPAPDTACTAARTRHRWHPPVLARL